MTTTEELEFGSRRDVFRRLLPAVLIGSLLWVAIAALGVIVLALHPSLASVAVVLMVLLAGYLIAVTVINSERH
jgi:hypothetical protein